MHATRAAGISIIAFAVAGVVWFVLEGTPASQGFDGDNPADMVRFVRAQPEVFARAGVALIVMAVTLVIGSLSVADAFSARVDRLALRSVTAFGLFAAAFFMIHGALRIGSSGPVIYIAGLREEWGESAYLAVQMAGIQGVAVAGILMLCLWSVGMSMIGLRSRALPLVLVILGIVPAFRLLGLLGPLGVLPDADILWLLGILSIVGVMVWSLLFGIVLLRRSFDSAWVAKGAR